MSGTTPNYAWPYPSGTDTPAGHTQMQALALAADASLRTVQNTTLSKPAAGVPYATGVLTALSSIAAITDNPLSGITASGGITVATPIVTVPTAGRYLITANVHFSVVATRAWLMLATGGSTFLWNGSTATTAGTISELAAVVTLAAGGTFKFQATASSFPVTTATSPGVGIFAAVYLGG